METKERVSHFMCISKSFYKKIILLMKLFTNQRKLKELLEKGILTEEEYQKKKDELVSQI